MFAKDGEIISAIEKVFKIAPRRQHCFPYFGQLMALIAKRNQEESNFVFWENLISDCASGKPLESYHLAIKSNIDQMRIESNHYSSILHLENIKNTSETFAFSYIQKIQPNFLSEKIDTELINIAFYLKDFQFAADNFKLMFRIIQNWNKLDPFFEPLPAPFSIFKDIWSNFLVEGPIDMNKLMSSKDKILLLNLILKNLVPVLQGLYRALIYTPSELPGNEFSSDFLSRFEKAKLLCFHSSIFPDLIVAFPKLLTVEDVNRFIPRQSLMPSRVEDACLFNKHFKLFIRTEQQFEEKIVAYREYPNLIEFLSNWRESYRKLFLTFLEKQLFHFKTGKDCIYQKKLEIHSEYLKHFEYLKYLNYFQLQLQQRQEQQKSTSKGSKKGNLTKDQKFIQNTIAILLKMITIFHRVDGIQTLKFVERFTLIHYSLVSLENEIQFACSLRDELISYFGNYPEENKLLEKILSPAINWNQLTVINTFLQSMTSYFENISEMEYHILQNSLIIKVFDTFRIDFLDLYRTNRTISRLLHFNDQRMNQERVAMELKIPSKLLIYLLSQQKTFANEVFQKLKEFPTILNEIWDNYTFPRTGPRINIHENQVITGRGADLESLIDRFNFDFYAVNSMTQKSVVDDFEERTKLLRIHLPISSKYFRYFQSPFIPEFITNNTWYFDYESAFELTSFLSQRWPVQMKPILERFLDIISIFVIEMDSIHRKQLVFIFGKMKEFLQSLMESAKDIDETLLKDTVIPNVLELLNCYQMTLMISFPLSVLSGISAIWNELFIGLMLSKSNLTSMTDPGFRQDFLLLWQQAYNYLLIIHQNFPVTLKEKLSKKVYREQWRARDDNEEEGGNQEYLEIDDALNPIDSGDNQIRYENGTLLVLIRICGIAAKLSLKGDLNKAKLFDPAIKFFENSNLMDKNEVQISSPNIQQDKNDPVDSVERKVSLLGCFTLLEIVLVDLLSVRLEEATTLYMNILHDYGFAQECLQRIKRFISNSEEDYHLPHDYERLFVSLFEKCVPPLLILTFDDKQRSPSNALPRVLTLFRIFNIFQNLSKPQEGDEICYHPCIIHRLKYWESTLQYTADQPLPMTEIQSQLTIYQWMESLFFYELISEKEVDTMYTFLLEGGVFDVEWEDLTYTRGRPIPELPDRMCYLQGKQDYENVRRLFIEWREIDEKEHRGKKNHQPIYSNSSSPTSSSKHSHREKKQKVSNPAKNKTKDNQRSNSNNPSKGSEKSREVLDELHKALNLMFLAFNYDAFFCHNRNVKSVRKAIDNYHRGRQEIIESKNQGRIPLKELANLFS